MKLHVRFNRERGYYNYAKVSKGNSRKEYEIADTLANILKKCDKIVVSTEKMPNSVYFNNDDPSDNHNFDRFYSVEESTIVCRKGLKELGINPDCKGLYVKFVGKKG